jgi:hypothetical protein
MYADAADRECTRSSYFVVARVPLSIETVELNLDGQSLQAHDKVSKLSNTCNCRLYAEFHTVGRSKG